MFLAIVKTMKCVNCHNDADDKWNYCPTCGFKFRDAKNVQGVFSVFSDLLKQFKDEGLFENADDSLKSFTIKIDNSDGVPKVKVSNPNKNKHEHHHSHHNHASYPKQSQLNLRTPHRNVEEPKTQLDRREGSFVVKMEIPDVVDVNDVEIIRFPESVEIRAHAKDKTYLKTIDTGSFKTVRTKQLINGTLFMELG